METVKSPPEQRIVLRNISWETYERLLDEREEDRVPRFAYDRGVLEIMSPSTEHETITYFIELLVAVLAEEKNINARGAGSTTFKREDIQRGFEPDACFYIQNEELVRGKPGIDLNIDPSPDLIIEIDITSLSVNKFPIYAQLGVPEVWRYDGERATIFKLEGGEYMEAAESVALQPLTAEILSGFIKESASLGSADWLRKVREWARSRS